MKETVPKQIGDSKFLLNLIFSVTLTRDYYVVTSVSQGRFLIL
jgi:hypothetical protein